MPYRNVKRSFHLILTTPAVYERCFTGTTIHYSALCCFEQPYEAVKSECKVGSEEFSVVFGSNSTGGFNGEVQTRQSSQQRRFSTYSHYSLICATGYGCPDLGFGTNRCPGIREYTRSFAFQAKGRGAFQRIPTLATESKSNKKAASPSIDGDAVFRFLHLLWRRYKGQMIAGRQSTIT